MSTTTYVRNKKNIDTFWPKKSLIKRYVDRPFTFYGRVSKYLDRYA